MAWMMPAVSAPRTPSGYPMATTNDPTRVVSASATVAVGIPVPRTRSSARSTSASRATRRPSRQRPSIRRTATLDCRATCVFVTTPPRGHSAPQPQRAGSKGLTGVPPLDRDSAKMLHQAREIHHHASGAARSLANMYLKVARLATANHRCDRTFAHPVGSQHALELRGFRDTGAPERHDDIADQHAGAGRRASG